MRFCVSTLASMFTRPAALIALAILSASPELLKVSTVTVLAADSAALPTVDSLIVKVYVPAITPVIALLVIFVLPVTALVKILKLASLVDASDMLL